MLATGSGPLAVAGQRIRRDAQLLAAAQGKHIGRPKGLDAENLAKVRKALGKRLSVAETVEPTGISLSSVKRYQKHLQATLSP